MKKHQTVNGCHVSVNHCFFGGDILSIKKSKLTQCNFNCFLNICQNQVQLITCTGVQYDKRRYDFTNWSSDYRMLELYALYKKVITNN